MAEEIKTSQVVEKPADSAPLEASIDSLLTSIPDLQAVFAGTPEQPSATPAKPAEQPPKTEGVPKKEPETPAADQVAALDALIPEGLKPEEDQPPPEAKPKKDEEFSEKVQARIDELTAKRKTAEEKAAALETELTELKSKSQAPAILAPSPASPLSDVLNIADLEKRKNDIEQAKSWCIQNLDGGNVSDGKGGTRFMEARDVKATLATAMTLLDRHIPERREFLVNKTAFDKEAQREYPALFKAGSEANKTYNSWLSVFPECQKYPDIALIVGDALVGQKIRLDRGRARGKNGNLPPSAQTPLATPAPAASPRVPQNKQLSGEALRQAIDTNPDQALDAFVAGLIDNSPARSR